MQEKLYGGRFEAGQDKFFEKFSESLHFDKRLIEADIQGSQAFARALESVGILNAEERARIVSAFEEIQTEARNPNYFNGANDEDVHSFVIRQLKEKTGVLADKIHTGRSRNEQVSLDTRLWLRSTIETTIAATRSLMGELLNLAAKYPQAAIPGYTHLRRAQAVLWPHYLLAYFEMFARDLERLRQTHARTNVLPLGIGQIEPAEFLTRVKDPVFGKTGEMEHDEVGGVHVVEHEIAVRADIHGVARDRRETEIASDRIAVEGKSAAGESSAAEGQYVRAGVGLA